MNDTRNAGVFPAEWLRQTDCYARLLPLVEAILEAVARDEPCDVELERLRTQLALASSQCRAIPPGPLAAEGDHVQLGPPGSEAREELRRLISRVQDRVAAAAEQAAGRLAQVAAELETASRGRRMHSAYSEAAGAR